MEIRGKIILLISPESWNHIFVSKHHYAIHLAKNNNRVYFLNPPGTVNLVSETDVTNLFSVTYSGFIKGMRYYPSVLQRYFIHKKFVELQKLCGVEFDIVWSFDNSVFYDFTALPEKILKISHIVDLNQDFQTEKAARTANFCFCTTEEIKDRLLRFNDKVFKINHGFNAQDSHNPLPLPGKSKIKALYAGNLAMPFLDWVLIDQAIGENSNVDFIFVGPNKDKFVDIDKDQNKAKQKAIGRANSFFTGKIESNKLMDYLTGADILLVAYQEKYHKDQANPHKMMEYLGSGKMIVATHTAEYVELSGNNWIAMSVNNNDFSSLLGGVLRNLELWNAVDRQNFRKDFALSNTYVNQIQKIEKHLSDNSER
jgi:glycosyltransferase involved in cell wall biosynthesis